MDINRDERSITPENFRRIREVFESALERPVHERKAFVAEACESNTAMIRELELMLAAEQESDRLFDRSAPSNARPGLCMAIPAWAINSTELEVLLRLVRRLF